MNDLHFLSENPINLKEEDLFNFSFYAEKVQKIIQHHSNNPNPLTIGIYGKWGSGKTSFLNLIKDQLEYFTHYNKQNEYLIYEFNPWRYSTSDEMIFDFFDGLAKRFFVKTDSLNQVIGKNIIKYSRYLKAIKISSTIGIPKALGTSVSFDISEIFKSLGEDFGGNKTITIDTLKDKVNRSIIECGFKVIIFIDDIDRLDKDEIYSILKLIKLNANFENFIFIVTIDQEHVAKAIHHRYGAETKDGELFLEKIINVPIHLPRIEEIDLKKYFQKHLVEVKNKLRFKNIEKVEEEFKKIDREFSAKYFSSPRNILKVLNSFFVSCYAIGDEVNLSDLFWCEYIKITNINCYNFLKEYTDQTVFISVNKIIDFNNKSSPYPDGEKKFMINTYKDVADIILTLFPDSKSSSILSGDLNHETLERELRINTYEHYDKYFSFHANNKVSEIKLLELKDLIENENTNGLIPLIKALFEDSINQQKIFIHIEKIIKDFENSEKRVFLYTFLFSNLNLIPNTHNDLFGLDFRLRIIELISSKLNLNLAQNEDVIINLSQHLTIVQLCHYTGKISEGDIRSQLEGIISKEAKEKFTTENLIYQNPKNPANKMIMGLWSKNDFDGFNKYILSTLSNIENVGLLVRNFPGFWNESFFGALEKDHFYYMKQMIDVDMLFSKIKLLSPDLITITEELRVQYNQENTIEDNLRQFIYFYLKET